MTETPDTAEAQPARPDHWEPPQKRPIVILAIVVGALLVLLAILAAWGIWPFGTGGPRTEDAYVQGRTIVLSPQVSGYIRQVHVDDFAIVRRGQPILEIDDSSYRAKAMEAAAQLDLRRADFADNRQQQASARAEQEGKAAGVASAAAQVDRSAEDYRRTQALVGDGSVSKRERDQALATYRQAAAALRQAQADVAISREKLRTTQVQRDALEAQVSAAQAEVYAAHLDLARTHIVAPTDGELGEVKARAGQFVATGTQLVSLVTPARWVIANFKERQTRDIRLRQPATIRIDALGGLRFDGFVERIAPATGSEFAVIKPDNATGNFVKVPQRIGVRIAIRANQPGA